MTQETEARLQKLRMNPEALIEFGGKMIPAKYCRVINGQRTPWADSAPRELPAQYRHDATPSISTPAISSSSVTEPGAEAEGNLDLGDKVLAILKGETVAEPAHVESTGDLGDQIVAILQAERASAAPAVAVTDEGEDLGDAIVRLMRAGV